MDADGRVAVTGAELVAFTVEGEGELLSTGSELGKAPATPCPRRADTPSLSCAAPLPAN